MDAVTFVMLVQLAGGNVIAAHQIHDLSTEKCLSLYNDFGWEEHEHFKSGAKQITVYCGAFRVENSSIAPAT